MMRRQSAVETIEDMRRVTNARSETIILPLANRITGIATNKPINTDDTLDDTKC